MPIVSGGSGGGSGLPSQWTAGSHGNVVATVDDVSVAPLTIQGIALAGNNVALLEVASFSGTDGLLVASDGGGGVRLVRLNTEAGGLSIAPAAGGVTALAALQSDRLVFRGPTVVPADALLGSSEWGLWLDATPAATKLMVKAKDSGGTVRTAAIALA